LSGAEKLKFSKRKQACNWNHRTFSKDPSSSKAAIWRAAIVIHPFVHLPFCPANLYVRTRTCTLYFRANLHEVSRLRLRCPWGVIRRLLYSWTTHKHFSSTKTYLCGRPVNFTADNFESRNYFES
jgi:hypothetical protein